MTGVSSLSSGTPSSTLGGMAVTGADKVRENLLRRMADRQGLTLSRSRRRDPRALDYGLYSLTRVSDGHTSEGLTIDEVEARLTGEPPQSSSPPTG